MVNGLHRTRVLAVVVAAACGGLATHPAQRPCPCMQKRSTASTVSPPLVPNHDSANAVDILEFPTVDNVHVGIHSYDSLDGGSASFGNRSSGDISGPGSYDIESLFSLRLDGLTDSTLAFQVQPGQVRANGAAGGFATIGDFVRGTFNFDIKLGGVSVFQQVVSAVVDDNEATAVSTPLIGGGQLQRQSGQRYGQLRHRGRRLHARPRCTRSDAYRRPRPVLLAGRSSRRPHLQCQQPRQQRR